MKLITLFYILAALLTSFAVKADKKACSLIAGEGPFTYYWDKPGYNSKGEVKGFAVFDTKLNLNGKDYSRIYNAFRMNGTAVKSVGRPSELYQALWFHRISRVQEQLHFMGLETASKFINFMKRTDKLIKELYPEKDMVLYSSAISQGRPVSEMHKHSIDSVGIVFSLNGAQTNFTYFNKHGYRNLKPNEGIFFTRQKHATPIHAKTGRLLYVAGWAPRKQVQERFPKHYSELFLESNMSIESLRVMK